MAFIDDIVKFHSFSKSTVRTGLTLGEAVNPSGHTVTSKQVRTDDIPWFVNSFQGDETAARKWAAANATDARHNDILYYGAEFKVGFTAPKCLIYVSKHEVDGKLVDLPAEQCGWQTFDLNAATTLKNADGKDVIAIHKNAKVEYVDGSNNAATNSNQQSLFVRRADGTLLDHFVAATDQIVGGQPSLGYNAVVSVSGKAIDEGEGSGNYIGNTYAGIIHFHSARTNTKANDGSVNGITVTCFEYIGDKLDTTIGNIREEIQDIVGVTMEGVVASVTANDAAKNAGIDVDSSAKTSPKITFTAGSVAANETKLVTGSAVKTYVDTTALAEGGSINTAIKNAIDAIPDVQAATTDVAGVVTISDNNAIATTETSTAAATVAAVAATRSAIAGELGALAVTVSSNKTEVDGKISAIEGKLASTGEIGQAIADVKATADSAVQSVTRATGSSTLLTVTDGTDVTISLSAEVATKSDAATAAANAVTTGLATGGNIAQAIATAKSGAEQTAATALSTARGEITTEIGTAVSGLETKLTTGEGSLGKKVEALETATGTTLPAAIEQALTDAKAYSDSLHTTSLDYVVLGDSESLPTASADTLGKIYLVKEGNTANGETAIDAISGSYVEYMTRKIGDGASATYAWEKIGTTAADLSAYAKTADLNATNVGSGAVKVTQTNGVVSSVSVATEALVSNNAIKTSVTDANALVKAGDALAAIKLAKPDNYVASVSAYNTAGQKVTSTQGAALTIKDAREAIYDADLWGTTVNVNNNVITVNNDLVDASHWGDYYSADKKISLNGAYDGTSTTYSVSDNKLKNNSGTVLANVETNKIVNGSYMFNGTAIASFNGDLSSLVNGANMFYCSKLASFSGDLSSLVNGANMFGGTNITSFTNDLSSLVNGDNMFSHANITSFNSDLSSLVNGASMFNYSSLTSFNNDLSSLVDGGSMFSGCSSLTSFDTDLSSLVDGGNMFTNSPLTSFNADLSSLTNAQYMFCNTDLTSFNGDLSSLVYGYEMFDSTPLTSFNGDLSSLVYGYNMFNRTGLTSFNGDLSSLAGGYGMFNNTNLDIDSLEIICESLPKKSDLQTWNANKEVIIRDKTYKGAYEPYTSGEFFYKYKTYEYPLDEDDGNIDNIKPIIYVANIYRDNVCTIHIKYTTQGIAALSEKDKATITALFEETANTKGWTIITNSELGGTYTPSITASDGTTQTYIYVIKHEADEDTATYIDAEGKYWTIDTAEAIIGPNVQYWSLFATVENALTEWGLTAWTKPTE